jgi:hypothetical protein
MSQATYLNSTTNNGVGITSLVLTKTCVLGDMLLLGIEMQNGAQQVSAVFDSAGLDGFGNPYNDWIQIAANNFRGTRMEVWVCRATAVAPASVTIELNGAQTVQAILAEYTPVSGFGIFATETISTGQNPTQSLDISLEVSEVSTPSDTMVTFFGAYSSAAPVSLSTIQGAQRANLAGSSILPALLLVDQVTGDDTGNLDTQASINQTVQVGMSTCNLQCITLLISTSFTLQNVPGFSDLDNNTLEAGSPCLGSNINKISENAAFGMVRIEVFQGLYGNGATVPLPVSEVDGYAYGQDEVIYVWGLHDSLNRTSLWMSAGDTLWFAGWSVDQTTGLVTCDEWYRRSGDNDNPTETTDGGLQVFTIAQRQQQNLVLSTVPTYADVPDSELTSDAAVTQGILQNLNENAKFSVVNSEAIYLGEFVDGNTVPTPVSPADGYAYSYAEVMFCFSWRWTPQGSAYGQPPLAQGQLAPFKCSINASTGVVSITVEMIDDAGNLTTESGWGRVQVVAFCSRAGVGTLVAEATGFEELNPATFYPGESLTATTLRQIADNVREAVCTPEFFGPTTYGNGTFVSLPVSPIDGYQYSRSELTYIFEWSDTTNGTGSNLRLPAFSGGVDPLTGEVSLVTFRLPPGGPIVDDDNALSRVNVITVAVRQRQAGSTSSPAPNPPSDLAQRLADTDAYQVNPQAGNYTAQLQDANLNNTVSMNSSSANTFTVPPNSSVLFPIGAVIKITQTGAGQTTLVAGAGVTINTPRSLTTRAQYSTVQVTQIAANVWVAAGDLT